MTTRVKSSATSRKVASKRVNKDTDTKVSSKKVVASVAAAADAVTAGTATSKDVAVALAGGAASVASVGASVRPADVAIMMDEKEVKLIELRQRISSRWAAGRFEDSPEFLAVSAAVACLDADLREKAVNGARLAWLARPENAEKSCTLSEVVAEINTNYAKEFSQLCGCSCPAAAAVRLYSYSNLSVSTINADSNINDYLIARPVPSGLSASGLVAVVMSVRVLVDIKRRFAAARAAARADFRNCMAGAARRASRLGVSPAVAARYFSFLLSAVPAADATEEKRLRKNLSSCWAACRKVENTIVLTGGTFGAIEDSFGGWCFPAVLPADAGAKVRKLWAKRVRLLSDIKTLEMLLSRC